MKRQVFLFVLIFAMSVCALGLSQATIVSTPVTSGYNISPDGAIVVGRNASGYGYWTEAAGFIPLPGSFSTAVSDDLVIAGTAEYEYMSEPDIDMAAHWNATSGWTPIYGFPGATQCSGSLSNIWDMSSNGRFMAGHSWRDDRPCRTHGMVYDITTGVMSRYPGVDDDSTSVKAISNDGTLMTGWEQTSNHIPVIWDQYQTPTRIAGAEVGQGTVVSADGVWAGGSMQQSAWLWSATSGVVQLGMLAGPYSGAEPTDMSADGSVVVGGHQIPGNPGLHNGWIWTQSTGMIKFQDYAANLGVATAGGWTSSPVPSGISDDGSVILFNQGGLAHLLEIDLPEDCELDYDCNGMVDINDVLYFYNDLQYYDYFINDPTWGWLVAGGAYHYVYCDGEVGDLDWNQNGVVEGPLLGWADIVPFYLQYLDYTAASPSYYTTYPDSGCLL